MNELSGTTAQEINTLHKGLESLLHQSIDIALQIGELLTAKKAELKHGEFGPWIKDNLIFSNRTAQRYMNLFENRSKIIDAGNISEAYKMLSEKSDTVTDLEQPGIGIRELSDEAMKLCNTLGTMNAGETVTGFAHGAGKANWITIQKYDMMADLFEYEIVYPKPGDEGSRLIVSSKEPISIDILLMYLLFKKDHIPIDQSTWMYPGLTPWILEENRRVKALISSL